MSARLVELRTSRRVRRCATAREWPQREDCLETIEPGDRYVRLALPPSALVPHFRARTLCAVCGAHHALETGKGMP